MFRKWAHGLVVGLLLGSLFVAFPAAQNYLWSSINGIPLAPGLQVTGQALFGAGSPAAPSVAIGATNNGFYSLSSAPTSVVGGRSVVMLTTNARFDGAGSIGFGAGDVASTSPDVTISREAAATLQMGADVNGAPTAQQLKAHDGITGTDIAGASLTLAGGRGTGAGAPGTLIFQTATALGSGTTAQTLATRAIIGATGALTLGTTAGTGAGAFYAGTYYVGTTAGADCTSAANVTSVKGIVTACSEPVPDPLTQAEVNQLRGMLAALPRQ